MSDNILFRTDRFYVEQLNSTNRHGEPQVRYVVRHPGAVVVVPILDENHIVLIENRRDTVGKTLLELPAGTREADETTDVTAHRELIEETGFRAGRMRRLIEFFASPGITDERMFVYVAHDLEEGPHAREPGEQIENRVASWTEIDRLLDEAAFEDGKTIAGLLFARRWLDRQTVTA